MKYTIQQISEITNGKLHGAPAEGLPIRHLLLDSRQVIFPDSSLFIALKGRRHDGYTFIKDLYRQGIRCFLVSELPDTDSFPKAVFLLVPDTHRAFHRLAAWHRRQYHLPVVGITGSNGKTIVKEWLFQLLHEDYHVVRSPKSYNSQTGVPLSVLQITPEHNLGIFEAGISQMGEMEKLEHILSPDIGILTNIGEAHSEGFPDLATKLQQKLLLFRETRTLIYCLDDERVAAGVRNAFGKKGQKQFFTWSATGKNADLQITRITTEGKLSIIEGKTDHTSYRINIPYTDHASVENAIQCWALMLHLGYEQEVIIRRMAKLEPVAMRLELKEGINGCTVINDSYNSDLTSLRIALNFLEQQSKTPSRTLFLSDILQSGQSPGSLYKAVANLLVEKKIDRLVGVGTDVELLGKLLPAGVEKTFFKDTASLLGAMPELQFDSETILLKGARRFGFERIANLLSVKVHQTVLEVNMTSLLNNLRVYQGQLRQGTKLMVMVKARAYGSGSIEVAKLLEFQHVDYLGVAYADEGVELRKAGIQLPIIVLNPEEATFDVLIRHRLEPEIYSMRLLQRFIRFLNTMPKEDGKLSNISAPLTRPAIHLKLDTGMHRLGFEESDLEELLALWSGNQPVPVTVNSIFSHLAASESAAHDAFTRQQVGLFNKMYEAIVGELGYRPLRHILNSGGIVRFPEYQMDMVRLGIGLYGIDASSHLQSKLKTVNTLKASISQIKDIGPGETIGYGRAGKAERQLRLATISIGYADGLLRRAGNGRYHVLINGEKAPLIGNVCMDMVMADISHIPTAMEGDEVIIFGQGEDGMSLQVEELAACLETIPYEIFTSISGRVKRVYIQE